VWRRGVEGGSLPVAGAAPACPVWTLYPGRTSSKVGWRFGIWSELSLARNGTRSAEEREEGKARGWLRAADHPHPHPPGTTRG